MKKFVFVYHGRAMRPEDVRKEDMKKTMDKWMTWFGSFKDQMVDGGNPFAPEAMEVSTKGTKTISKDMFPATGYTIINAKDLNEAVSMAKGCPALENDGAVRVYEAVPM
jgi:hypothetical protein